MGSGVIVRGNIDIACQGVSTYIDSLPMRRNDPIRGRPIPDRWVLRKNFHLSRRHGAQELSSSQDKYHHKRMSAE